jgi:cation transport regulator
MPYSNINDLPNAVKDNLPTDAQKIWMSAFNYAYGKFKNWDESRYAKYAWGAVSRRYHKNKEGKWVKLNLSNMDETIDFILF